MKMELMTKRRVSHKIIPDVAPLTQCFADENSISTQELLLEDYEDDPGKVPNVGVLITMDGENTMKHFFKDDEGIQTCKIG